MSNPTPGAPNQAMDRETFNKFRQIVYEKSGITLGPSKEALVSARVGKRMRALGIGNAREYLKFVLNDASGEEFIHLIDAISTNVTSFFRESQHFDFIRETVGLWRQKGQTHFTFWSAASSTGEEPYSLAITLMELFGREMSDVRILATDISTRVLAKCKEGVYTADRVETVPQQLRDRYFDPVQMDGQRCYRVRDNLRRMIKFARLNLNEPPFPMKGPMDIVLCRNVMIYFDNEVRSRLLAEIHRILKPGGNLLVGHAESLTGMVSQFKSVRPSIYVK
jgi:chemotaxis protein methyltransferase CheR